ncbi:hypothetical protein B0T22DRAFT_311139 [Podospora appendiculata]|uniref:Uncharacterized protein n=1 Tax=Podospora appendiculata TaxID=314037 RepID=A0AAE0WZ53_9PEZI|nr:hypothetical protein B0T22DRAFT_311139 [Podospora appendiculata]
MNCTLSEVCPECGDSRLSIASSSLSFVTFGFGFLLSCIAFAAVTRNADNEIGDLTATVLQMAEHIDRIVSSLSQLEIQGDPVLKGMFSLMQSSLKGFREAHSKAQRYLESFKTPTSVCTRIRWWFYEKETAAAMARLQTYKQHFTAIQITFLMRKLETQSDNIELLQRDLRERPKDIL